MVGAQLLVQLLDAARVLNYTSLIALVLAKNHPSLRGLLKAGFEEVARVRDAALLHGEWIDLCLQKERATKTNTPSPTAPHVSGRILGLLKGLACGDAIGNRPRGMGEKLSRLEALISTPRCWANAGCTTTVSPKGGAR